MKELKKYNTFEETLKAYDRYLMRCASSFNQDKYFDDFIQCGSIGLHDSYLKYDESMGPFHPFALTYIRGAMMRFISEQGRTIRIPNNMLWSDEDLRYLSTISLQTPIDEQGSTLEDLIPADEETISFDTSIVKSLLRCLDKDDLELISLKYNLADDGEQMTNEEIAKIYGCSRENIRQKLVRVMRKLRAELINKQNID